MPKFAEHHIDRQQVGELIDNNPTITANRKNRAASHLLIGRDNSGRCIAVPILPTEDPTVWRPITAWYCKPSEAAKLRWASKGDDMTAKTRVTRYESIQEPLDEEERELMGPDTWDWDNPLEVITGPGGVRWVFEVPLEKDELSEIEPAAEARGMTVIAFLKDAALRAARQDKAKQRRAS